ncbi:MAG: electron transfer flavoprotein subunit beta/FixA family protein [Candidatus Lokiarchaeota archaeon]|nr:electron transfer flavoprotein subunit beta/FixA family protein [Candidatus Lokiarchaeota archaeon]
MSKNYCRKYGGFALNIIVCLKQVPDADEVKTDPETGRIVREGIKGTVNPFDMFILEEALRLKEQFGGKITLLSMGPKDAIHTLYYGLAVGADEGYLLSDSKFAGSDTLATSYALSCAIKTLGLYDLIMCGIKTTDGDTGQVGANLAELLDIPSVYYVNRILSYQNDFIKVERFLEDRSQILEVHLPCLISIIKGANVPRMPTLEGKIEAEGKQLKILNAFEVNAIEKYCGIEGSPTRVIEIFLPEKRKKGVILKGCREQNITKLIQFLKNKKISIFGMCS